MATAKFAAQEVMDDGLNALIAGAAKFVVIDSSKGGDNETYAGVNTNRVTADTVLAGALTGPTGASNRAATVLAENGIVVTVDGTADGVALIDTGGTKVWYTVPISNPQGVSVSNEINLGAWTVTINQATQ